VTELVTLRVSAGFASAVLIVLAVLLAWLTNHPAQFLGGGVALLGILGFMMCYRGDDEHAMRNAIAGSVVLVFIVSASLTLFSPVLQGVTTGESSYQDDDQTIAEESTAVLETALDAEAEAGSDGTASSNGDSDGNGTNGASTSAEIASPTDTVPKDLLGVFRWVVVAVIGFYFASSTIEKFAND
jgi:hypothetical protein